VRLPWSLRAAGTLDANRIWQSVAICDGHDLCSFSPFCLFDLRSPFLAGAKLVGSRFQTARPTRLGSVLRSGPWKRIPICAHSDWESQLRLCGKQDACLVIPRQGPRCVQEFPVWSERRMGGAAKAHRRWMHSSAPLSCVCVWCFASRNRNWNRNGG
jgi:hypothetical protein